MSFKNSINFSSLSGLVRNGDGVLIYWWVLCSSRHGTDNDDDDDDDNIINRTLSEKGSFVDTPLPDMEPLHGSDNPVLQTGLELILEDGVVDE